MMNAYKDLSKKIEGLETIASNSPIANTYLCEVVNSKPTPEEFKQKAASSLVFDQQSSTLHIVKASNDIVAIHIDEKVKEGFISQMSGAGKKSLREQKIKEIFGDTISGKLPSKSPWTLAKGAT